MELAARRERQRVGVNRGTIQQREPYADAHDVGSEPHVDPLVGGTHGDERACFLVHAAERTRAVLYERRSSMPAKNCTNSAPTGTATVDREALSGWNRARGVLVRPVVDAIEPVHGRIAGRGAFDGEPVVLELGAVLNLDHAWATNASVTTTQ